MTAPRWWYNDRGEACEELRTPGGIHFRVHGDREKATCRAIFLQGVAASLDNNRFLLKALARHTGAGIDEDICVVTPDTVGIGQSVVPPDAAEYTISRMARDANDVVEAAGWGAARVHVVGHSMGGMVAMEFSCLFPERVASLVLLSTTAHRRAVDFFPSAAAVPDGARFLLRAATRSSGATPEDRVRLDLAMHFAPSYFRGALTAEEREDLGVDARKTDRGLRDERRQGWHTFYLSVGNAESERQDPAALKYTMRAACRWRLSRAGLRALRRHRVLVVHGRGDLVIRASCARHLYGLLAEDRSGLCAPRGDAPDAANGDKHLRILPRAAHMVTSSHSARLASEILDFWSRGPELYVC